MGDTVTLDELIRVLQHFRRDDYCGRQFVSLHLDSEDSDEDFEIDNIKHSDGIEIRIRRW